MSTADSMPPAKQDPDMPTDSQGNIKQIKLISHSPLFYWWPVWFFGFFMAAWTYVENHRFAALPADTKIVATAADGTPKSYILTTNKDLTKVMQQAVTLSKNDFDNGFPTRVSHHAWLGTIFILILILTVIITNVPLRGLWSFVVIIMVVVISLFITVFHGWDDVYEQIGNLKIYINMAGYLFIATAVLVLWLVATFIFDRRTFIIFSPGQIKVCEHIGASVRTYDATGVSFEKQRDDLFRHYILGFGSGDLVVRTAGAERHEIKLANVLGIGWKLRPIEDLLREKATTSI